MKQILFSILLGLFTVALSPAADPKPTSASKEMGVAAVPVPMQAVRIEGFWKDQFKRQTLQWIPHCIQQMEKGGRGEELLNLVATGQQLRGEPVTAKFKGAPWSDAYIYNTIEAICLALEIDPGEDAEWRAGQEKLRAKVEEWIPTVLAAQEPSGYIHSFHALNGKAHFSELGAHEFYVMGYLIEMGVAHYRMTQGKDRRLYDAALKCANHLDSVFGPTPKRIWTNGHPGLELALCRLGEMVNSSEGKGKGDKYIALAHHFVSHQHSSDHKIYNQSEQPAVQMREARGHAVRATYFYTAMAGLALLRDDQPLATAVDAIWSNAIDKKEYLTGGVGASHEGEAFAGDYELPNDAYCESCAGCGMSFWAAQMYRRSGVTHPMDVQERLLYNNVLGSVALDGTNFFYQNPLTSSKARYAWHGCPCCVGNIPRTLFAIKDLMYATNPARDTLFVNHFVASQGQIADLAKTRLEIQQATRYPWDGGITLKINPKKPAKFSLALRIPDRAESKLYTAQPEAKRYTVSINGKPAVAQEKNGYAILTRSWKAGDRVELSLPMEVQRVVCDEKVAANRGLFAFQRGPIVYNFENVDHAQYVRKIRLPAEPKLVPIWKESLLGGVMALEGEGLVGIPNYARLNRGRGSQVWLSGPNAPIQPDTIASDAKVTVSYRRGANVESTINDLVYPTGAKWEGPHFAFFPHVGTEEWIQYTLEKPVQIKSSKIWWFDDTGRGECRLPASWRLTYQDSKGAWIPVENSSPYEAKLNEVSEVNFKPVTTNAIRLEIKCQAKVSAGVHEWSLE